MTVFNSFFFLLLLLQIACRDYPHPRHHCVTFPFGTTPHEKHCDMVRWILQATTSRILLYSTFNCLTVIFSLLWTFSWNVCSAIAMSATHLHPVCIGQLVSPVCTIAMPLTKRRRGRLRGETSSWAKVPHYQPPKSLIFGVLWVCLNSTQFHHTALFSYHLPYDHRAMFPGLLLSKVVPQPVFLCLPY